MRSPYVFRPSGIGLIWLVVFASPVWADPPEEDVWAKRTLELASELVHDPMLASHRQDFVRDLSVNVLASEGCNEAAMSLRPSGDEQKSIRFHYDLAAGLAKQGDLKQAFRITDPLPRYGKLRALALVAIERAKQRDIAGVRATLAKCDLDSFDPENRHSVLESVTRNLSDVGELDEARKLAEGIQNDELRSSLLKRINEVGRVLTPSEPGYFDQQIKLAVERKLADDDLQFIRALKSAEVAGAEGRLDFARQQLRKASQLIQDAGPDKRLMSLLQIGEVAQKAGAKEIAQTSFRTAWTEYLQRDPKPSNFAGLFIFWESGDRWQSIGNALPPEEIEQFIQQARERNDDNLIAALIVSLAASSDPERAEAQYQTLDVPYQKWLTAMRMLDSQSAK